MAQLFLRALIETQKAVHEYSEFTTSLYVCRPIRAVLRRVSENFFGVCVVPEHAFVVRRGPKNVELQARGRFYYLDN